MLITLRSTTIPGVFDVRKLAKISIPINNVIKNTTIVSVRKSGSKILIPPFYHVHSMLLSVLIHLNLFRLSLNFLSFLS